MQKVKVDVGKDLRQFVGAALHRLRYLFPDCDFSVSEREDEVIALVADAAEHKAVAREINYALYREKIFADTLSIRKKILGAGRDSG